MQTKPFEKYFFIGFLTLVAIFTVVIFQPFLGVIIVGASLAVVLHPLYLLFMKKITRGHSLLAALLTVVFFIFVLCVPLLGIVFAIFNQSQGAYQAIVITGGTPFIQTFSNQINEFLPVGFSIDVQSKLIEFFSFVSRNLATIFTATMGTLLSFLLVIISVFYFLKDGDEWKATLIRFSPLSDTADEKIFSRLGSAINGIIRGYFFIAIIQGLLMFVGLAIFGVSNPALWGLLAAFASLIPSIGTALIAIPAIIFLVATGAIGSAIGLSIWSMIVVGLVDNLLSPIIVSNKTEMPPFIVLFAILGGIALMGPVGILVGPLCVSLLYILVSMYRNEVD